MNVYFDSSVLLRRLLKQSNRMEVSGHWKTQLTSELTRVEMFRTIDRIRLGNAASDQQVSVLVQELIQIFDRVNEIELSFSVLKRASESFPTFVTTLDALHLASAYLWREVNQEEVIFLTHDIQQGIAAKALGMQVGGI